MSSPQTGFLYLINEGPQLINGLPDYNLLFPTARVNGGTAQVQANQPLPVPGPELPGVFLDAQTGTEKIWLAWSAERLDELENLRPRLTERSPFRIWLTYTRYNNSSLHTPLLNRACPGRSQ
jgi:hypothetical protein